MIADLSDVFHKLGAGIDHVGGALNKLMSTEVVYAGEKPDKPDESANIMNALAYNETRGVKGDPYSFSQPSGSSSMGQAMGKYQTTEGELKSWSKDFMGREITPKEYQASPALQDEYTTKKIQTLLTAGATPAEILAMHRGGLTGYADPKVRQKKVLERQDYVNNGLAYLKTLGDNEENK